VAPVTFQNRSLDFLLLFKQFHKENSGKLKVLFYRQKCVILHVDGTFRSGGKVVYVLQDDSFEIIVDASLIPSEAEEYVTPILQDFKKTYGQPDVVVRDMAKGPALSISTVFPKSLQQVCQVHFIILEKNLIMDLHKTLKELIVKHKFTSALKGLREVNEDKSDDVIKKLQRRWAHIAADYLLHPLKKRVKWISCPISYYVQYCRVKEVAVFVRRIIRCNASHNLICSEVMELDKCLKSILEDSEITRSSYRLQRTMNWLDDLRNHLRVTRENHLKDVPPEEVSLEDCKKNIKNKLAEILQEVEDHKIVDIIGMILAGIDGEIAPIDEILTLLQRENPYVRNQAISILQDYGNAIKYYIVKYLIGEDRDLRIFAINVLGDVAFPESRDMLVELLEDEQDVNVAMTAVDYLGEIGLEEDLLLLESLKERFPNEFYVSFAVDSSVNAIKG